jgi:hypothetical protein
LLNVIVPVFQFTPFGLEKTTVNWLVEGVTLGAPSTGPDGAEDDDEGPPFVIPGSARWHDVEIEKKNKISKVIIAL